jgi:hypothetical protein
MRRMPNTCVVGITGHRPNRLHMGEAHLVRQLHPVLNALRRGKYGPRLVALSALAEGADRIFAEVALGLGYRLEVALPFARANYEQTFTDQDTTPIFRTILARAASITELDGALADTKAAYEAAGRHIVDKSNILIAVWDGKPAAGRGGTPDIVGYAVHAHKPVVWIDAGKDDPPKLFPLPSTSRRSMDPVEYLAVRAKPIALSELADLAMPMEEVGTDPPDLKSPDPYVAIASKRGIWDRWFGH